MKIWHLILCLIGRHEMKYRYRQVGGIRHWDDGSWSNGPEHIGWICDWCHKYKS